MTQLKPAIDGFSPVSYFEVGQAEPGRPEFRADYGGKRYLFTSASQVAAFNADPEKYLPAFGGTCAFGHSVEKEFPVDPTSFKIVDGKLLLFLKNADVDAKALWEKEGDVACMVKATRHYQTTRKA